MEHKVEKLAFVGKVIKLEPISGADFIISAIVVCGPGGMWKGIVRKDAFSVGDKCMVFLPDCMFPMTDDYRFMEKHGWRVRMRRFKGAPSEVMIMPLADSALNVGLDATTMLNVTKFYKPVPANMSCDAIGFFPSFVPKTDEPNYQRAIDLVDKLHGLPYYITEKADGSSTTAFKLNGNFSLCSRNLELQKNCNSGYWCVAKKYDVEQKLPEGIALQWETVGPKIQGNPMGFTEIDGRAFSAYDITKRKYLELDAFLDLCQKVEFPTVPVLAKGDSFDKSGVELLGEGVYSNGRQREGVVVRSQHNYFDNHPISFKVINLDFDR